MELSEIIVKLLESNNFVSLPGIGSFVQTYQSAKLSNDGKTFLPPGQFVSFDTNRTFNDEAIERFLAEFEGKSALKARELTEAFVNDIKAKLDSNSEVVFAGIGSIKKDGDAIVLSPCSEDDRLTSTYGLSPIAVTPKATEKIDKPKEVAKPAAVKPYSQKKKGILIPIISVGFVAIFGVLLFILVPSVRFWEKENSFKVVSNKHSKVDTLASINKTELQQVDSIPVVTDKKQALYYEETKQPDGSMYYIISGSFTSRQNAQKYFNGLVEKGFKPEILEANGIFRVAKCRYSERNRALRELERMRREKPNEAVWLLGL